MSTAPAAAPPVAEPAGLLAVRCVRALLERHGLPKYRQSAWLADAIGLSYAQAHRKMNGAAAWTLEELERVGALLGESLADVVAPGHAQGAVAATLCIGKARVPCELWVGASVEQPHPDALVAVQNGSEWTAELAADAGDRPTFAIDRLQARPSRAERKRIAVLDDDRDLTDSICAHLQDSGYEARPFYRTADLQARLKTERYDAFVLDWIVGEASTVKLIAALRAQDAICPILVLTAEVVTGVVQESEIAQAVANFNFVFAEKPVRMAILSASLARAFAAR
jgi:CheY-like chemotaxis protein